VTRTITSGMQTEIAAESATLFHFMELQFSGGTVYFTTAPHDVAWDSKTWQGIGGALGFDLVQESSDISAAGLDMIMSGVDQAIVSTILSQFYVGRVVKIWLSHLDSAGAIVADPLLIFDGKMNGGFTIDEVVNENSPGSVTIKARIADRFSELDARKGLRSNLHDHNLIFPGDPFFEFVPSIANKNIKWGGPSFIDAGDGNRDGY